MISIIRLINLTIFPILSKRNPNYVIVNEIPLSKEDLSISILHGSAREHRPMTDFRTRPLTRNARRPTIAPAVFVEDAEDVSTIHPASTFGIDRFTRGNSRGSSSIRPVAFAASFQVIHDLWNEVAGFKHFMTTKNLLEETCVTNFEII